MPVATPAIPEHFDYRNAATSARLSDAQLKQLIRHFERDYPDDLMLRELHVLRACNALQRGAVTIEEVLASTTI